MKWVDYRNTILSTVDAEAFYLSELPEGARHGDAEYKTQCPFAELHDGGVDKNPSFTVNLTTGVYYCNTCHSKGNIHTYYKNKYHVSAKEAWFFFGDQLGLPRPDGDELYSDTIDPEVAFRYHKDLLEIGGNTLDFLLNERCLTMDVINRFQIGWNGERYTIPIYDLNGRLVNIRLYTRMPVDGRQKVLNYVDENGNHFGGTQLYGIENLQSYSHYIIVAEGEMDRLCCEAHNIRAVTSTSGAGTWKQEWNELFKNVDKTFACYDNDRAGYEANGKLLRRVGKYTEVAILQWPEDFKQKGDITDYFAEGHSRADFLNMLNTCATTRMEDEDVDTEVDDSDAIETNLLHSTDAKYAHKRIKMPVMVSGKTAQPGLYPSRVLCTCTSNDQDGKMCNYCPLAEGPVQIDFKADSNAPLAMIECTDEVQENFIRKQTGVPNRCHKFSIETVSLGNLEEIRMVPIADTQFTFDRDTEHVVRTGYYMGRGIKTNCRYTITGYMHNNPKNQRATFIFDKAYPEHDAITEFKVTDEVKRNLDVLKLHSGQEVWDKMNEIHKDFEYNVTRVWHRRSVAMAVDLIYHTPLHFYFQKQFIKRGWGECLIIGDSGQAKSTVVEMLMRHFGLGEMLSGESSKRTGIAYSTQQVGNSWVLIWGALPLNDGGLVAIDEFSGLSTDDIAELSEIRSAGVCKVRNVVTDETSARTRAIYISNPRSGRPLSSETYGVQAILKLFGTAEDVRRLDLAVGVASGEVDTSIINAEYDAMAPVEHMYTSEICKTAVMWAWSRTPEQIQITDDATKLILHYANQLSMKYSATVPLVEPADMRLKLARLSVAAAARLASTDESYENIVVKPEHVQFIVDFLQDVYDSPALQYDALSQNALNKEKMDEPRIKLLRKKMLQLPLIDFNAAVDGALMTAWLSPRELQIQINADALSTNQYLHFLLSNYLIENLNRGGYKRTMAGEIFLRDLQAHPFTQEEMDRARNGM